MIDFATAFPNSAKVFDERVARLTADGSPVTLRVPAREVALAVLAARPALTDGRQEPLREVVANRARGDTGKVR